MNQKLGEHSIPACTKRTRLPLLGLGFLVINLAVVAHAATFNIADGDVAGLIAAISAANANPDADTINLAPGGTYMLTQVGAQDAWNGPSGLPIINGPLTINGQGATIQRSTAAGTPDFRILWWGSGDLILDGVTIKGGKGGDGAGILIKGLTNPQIGKVVIRNSTITENDTQYSGPVSYGGYLGGAGGGIQNIGSLTLINSTISHNRSISGYGGGGFSNFADAKTTIINSTIFENRNEAGRGDAIADDFSSPGSIILKNSILASPTQGAGDGCYVYPGYPGVVVSLGHNIASDATCGLTGSGDLNSTNPLLGPLANNGGLTPTDLPLLGSPAIDGVPIASCTDASNLPITTDQRGVARPQGSACDIGSVEVVQRLYSICFLYDSSKAVNSGATLPVKLELCDGSGNDLSSSSIVLHATSITQISTSTTGQVQDSGNANPDNDFRFDATLGTTGGYIFNLSTKGLATGTYNLNFTVTGDSFVYASPFQVK